MARRRRGRGTSCSWRSSSASCSPWQPRERPPRKPRRGPLCRGPARDGGKRRLGHSATGRRAVFREAAPGLLVRRRLRGQFGPSEWSVRLAPALFALAGIFATYGAARRDLRAERRLLVGGRPRLVAPLPGPGPHPQPRHAAFRPDEPERSSASSSAMREPPGGRRRGLFYGLYLCAALATLTKGLEGVLVTGAVMFFWLLCL